eukprot:COSAG03_NODE_14819_length_450_cov_403.387464_1_plen_81_part_10
MHPCRRMPKHDVWQLKCTRKHRIQFHLRGRCLAAPEPPFSLLLLSRTNHPPKRVKRAPIPSKDTRITVSHGEDRTEYDRQR